MWIQTKAVLCDGRRRDPPLDLQPFLGIIVESVSWVTKEFLWEHEWITETNVTLKENVILEALKYDIDVLFSHLNRKFVHNGTKVGNFRETVNCAIELTCNIAFDGGHTPRSCFLRAVTVFICYVHYKDWNLDEEMQGGTQEKIDWQHSPLYVTVLDVL